MRRIMREAERIRVEIRGDRNSFFIRIEDDGKGFEPPASDDEGAVDHHGLRTMRERAKRLGAEFQLRSGPGRGTVVELKMKL